MVLVDSEKLAEKFIEWVIQYDNQGVLQDLLEGWMKKTKFCGLPKLFLAKKLGRKYGILLYEKPIRILATGKKSNMLFIDTESAKKLCISAKPRDVKLVKCYIGANVLTNVQVEMYKRDHNLHSLNDLIKVVDSQQDINEYDQPDKSKVSFFIAPKDEEIEKRKRNFDTLKIITNRNCSPPRRRRNLSSIFRSSVRNNSSGRNKNNGVRVMSPGSFLRGIEIPVNQNLNAPAGRMERTLLHRELETPTRGLSNIESIYNF